MVFQLSCLETSAFLQVKGNEDDPGFEDSWWSAKVVAVRGAKFEVEYEAVWLLIA